MLSGFNPLDSKLIRQIREQTMYQGGLNPDYTASVVGETKQVNQAGQLQGTGHADTNKWEWLTNQHRDSSSSYLGHFDMLNYFSLAENEAKARVKFNLLEKMVQPCGPPPERVED